MNVHILFEQSGTFKDAFTELGFNAQTYDHSNAFNRTDHVIDLFEEINKAQHSASIFDNITSEDLIVAFFPCTYFSVQNNFIWNRSCYNFRNWTDERIDKYISEREERRGAALRTLKNLVQVCTTRNIPLIIENPYTHNYLLEQPGFERPDIVVWDRSTLGDNMRKPTMFYTYRVEIKDNEIDVPKREITKRHNQTKKGIARSIIHKDFAVNFIKKYLL